MTTYRGPATFFSADDEPIAHLATVSILVTAPSEGLRSWRGAFDAGENLAPINDATRIRLPDGTEGDIIVTNSNVEMLRTGQPRHIGEFVGSGEPPNLDQ